MFFFVVSFFCFVHENGLCANSKRIFGTLFIVLLWAPFCCDNDFPPGKRENGSISLGFPECALLYQYIRGSRALHAARDLLLLRVLLPSSCSTPSKSSRGEDDKEKEDDDEGEREEEEEPCTIVSPCFEACDPNSLTVRCGVPRFLRFPIAFLMNDVTVLVVGRYSVNVDIERFESCNRG